MIPGVRLTGVRSIRELNLVLYRYTWVNEYGTDRSGSTAGLAGVQYPMRGGWSSPLSWEEWSVEVTERRITFTPDDRRNRRVFTWKRGG